MTSSPPTDVLPLVGRAEDLAAVTVLLEEVGSHGGALVLGGGPGIGKSRLLEEAAAVAASRGMDVLRATGVESEAQLPFAALSQLLRPVRARTDALSPGRKGALDVALGLVDGPAPEYFVVAMAVLDLLAEIADETPLLVLLEDAQWLDRSSADVFAFLARRLEADPIVLLAAVRDGYPAAFENAGLPARALQPLRRDAAGSLLDAVAAGLTRSARERILDQADGNPLALIELPISTGEPRGDEVAPGLVPLTDRLERAFAARVSDLPRETRLVLLAAALNDSDSLEEALAAGSALAGRTLDLGALSPAKDAGIADVDLRTIRFRHPLVRSAVGQGVALPERRQAHEALAGIHSDQPDRRVWHRAALVGGEDEEIAVELEAAADRARRRGAIRVAVAALRRAGELSTPETRAPRLLRAATLAFELGHFDLVAPLVRQAESAGLGPLEAARVEWLDEMVGARPLREAARFVRLIEMSDRAEKSGDHELSVDLLWLVASRSWWADPGPEARRPLIDAARRFGGAEADDPRIVLIYAYADPYGHAPEVVRRLRRAIGDRDPDVATHFGPAAMVVGALELGGDFVTTAVEGLREAGRLGHLPRLLTLQAGMAARLGDWDTAVPAAAEARRLAAELAQPSWIAASDAMRSLVDGMLGDDEAAEALAAQAERMAPDVKTTVAFAQFGRVASLLGRGRHDEAFSAAQRLFVPGDPAHQPYLCSWMIADLAEAALHAGRVAEGRARIAEVAALAGAEPGEWVAIGLAHARALLADEAEAEERYAEALSLGLDRWPFQRARLELAYGQWLRRRRRIVDSRDRLRSAREAFDRLGCERWGDLARKELRAAGETSRGRVPARRHALTAQELQIARLAAEGLSNREIGQKLFLSHRTVSTHLYRVFPKLGISSRGQLAAALAET